MPKKEETPPTPPLPSKPTCPECGIELVLVDGALPKKCEKCGFRIAGFGVFKRWFKVAQKENEEEKPKPKKQSSDDSDEDGIFDSLAEL